MAGELVVALFAIVMGIALGFHIAKQMYLHRFWEAEHLFRKVLYKREGTGEYFSDKIACYNYDIIFNGIPIKKAEQKINEPDVIFVITK
jgi:hypothetical protein